MFRFLLLFFVAVAFDCNSYVENIPDGEDTISKDERSVFITKLCSATSSCHNTPVLNSFNDYVEDVDSCYSSQLFNFDRTIFTKYKKNVTDLLDAEANKKIIAQLYDMQNIQARDKLNAVIDTVRLRDSYIREFRYSSAKTTFGDIELQLVHRCTRFSANVRNQLDTSRSFSSLSHVQLKDVQDLHLQLKETTEKYKAAEQNLALATIGFANFVETLQKNVVDSLIRVHY